MWGGKCIKKSKKGVVITGAEVLDGSRFDTWQLEGEASEAESFFVCG